MKREGGCERGREKKNLIRFDGVSVCFRLLCDGWKLNFSQKHKTMLILKGDYQLSTEKNFFLSQTVT